MGSLPRPMWTIGRIGTIGASRPYLGLGQALLERWKVNPKSFYAPAGGAVEKIATSPVDLFCILQCTWTV